jgi:fructose-1,6-bisphosphatase
MTRSKTELATILVKLRGDVTDPKEFEQETARLAGEMSLMKLCYEIQKVEEEREAVPATATEEPTVTEEEPPKEAVPLTTAEETIVEELKAPEKSTTKQKHKHILSWLLDSSSDEDES